MCYFYFIEKQVKHRELKSLLQGHTAKQWQSLHLNLDLLTRACAFHLFPVTSSLSVSVVLGKSRLSFSHLQSPDVMGWHREAFQEHRAIPPPQYIDSFRGMRQARKMSSVWRHKLALRPWGFVHWAASLPCRWGTCSSRAVALERFMTGTWQML